MTDLDEIVEAFKLNIERIATERLTEVLGMAATEINSRIPASENVSRARLNEILDKIEKETNDIEANSFRSGARYCLKQVREEIQKL